MSRAARLRARLSARDLGVLASLQRLRLMTGEQLRRLHVHDGSVLTQARRARSMLERLHGLRLVVRLARRIGGLHAGSAGFVYGLSGLGQAVLDAGEPPRQRRRTPTSGKPAFQDHVLAVAELYVQLHERARVADETELLAFDAEPDCWRSSTGIGGQRLVLKPDAYVELGVGELALSSFIELDLASESLPTITSKCQRYADYWQTGQEQRAAGVFPRVWWLAPTPARAAGIGRALRRLASDAQALFAVGLTDEAPDLLTSPPGAEARS